MTETVLHQLEKPKPMLMSVADTAEYLGVGRQTIYQWIHNGIGPRVWRPTPESHTVRFRRSDIDAWVESCIEDPSNRVARVGNSRRSAGEVHA